MIVPEPIGHMGGGRSGPVDEARGDVKCDIELAPAFEQRGGPRPNRLGATSARILRLDGRRPRVRGLDAIDSAPVLDVKPEMSGVRPRGELREPEWARAIMRDYW
ncbi:MAG: SAM-dependent methyltransferase [Rhizobiales bacterium]|nr:SAM-dependent methyltransferase [Hyphomicrobiales bacterium]